MAHICFLIPNMRGGGAERIAINLLRAFVDWGHDVDLVLLRAEGELLGLVPAGVRVIDLKAPRFRSALRPLIRYLRVSRPDVMQVSMWPLTLIALGAAKMSRSSVRVTTSDHVAFSAYLSDRPRHLRLVGISMRAIYPLAHARIAVSDGVADDLARISRLPRSSFTVIYNPVDLPEPDADAIAAARAYWAGADLRLLAVGTLKSQKNLLLLIEAVARIDRSLGWHLVILGEGEERQAIEDRVRALGVASRVTLAGFRTDPAPYFHAAEIYVLSSDYEGLPTVLIEALQAGLKVASTDCESGPREILAGAPLSRLVPPGDADALARAIQELAAKAPDAAAQRAAGDRFRGTRAAREYLQAMGVEHDAPSTSVSGDPSTGSA